MPRAKRNTTSNEIPDNTAARAYKKSRKTTTEYKEKLLEQLVVQQLETGIVPWQTKHYDMLDHIIPCNPAGKEYTGMHRHILLYHTRLSRYPTFMFSTYKTQHILQHVVLKLTSENSSQVSKVFSQENTCEYHTQPPSQIDNEQSYATQESDTAFSLLEDSHDVNTSKQTTQFLFIKKKADGCESNNIRKTTVKPFDIKERQRISEALGLSIVGLTRHEIYRLCGVSGVECGNIVSNKIQYDAVFNVCEKNYSGISSLLEKYESAMNTLKETLSFLDQETPWQVISSFLESRRDIVLELSEDGPEMEYLFPVDFVDKRYRIAGSNQLFDDDLCSIQDSGNDKIRLRLHPMQSYESSSHYYNVLLHLLSSVLYKEKTKLWNATRNTQGDEVLQVLSVELAICQLCDLFHMDKHLSLLRTAEFWMSKFVTCPLKDTATSEESRSFVCHNTTLYTVAQVVADWIVDQLLSKYERTLRFSLLILMNIPTSPAISMQDDLETLDNE